MFARSLLGRGNSLNISRRKLSVLFGNSGNAVECSLIRQTLVVPRSRTASYYSISSFSYSNDNERNNEGSFEQTSFFNIKSPEIVITDNMKKRKVMRNLIEIFDDRRLPTDNAYRRSFSNQSSSQSGRSGTERKENHSAGNISNVGVEEEEKKGDRNRQEESRRYYEKPLPRQFKLPDAVSLQDSKDAYEAYRFIRRRQKNNVERARAKTSANVQRALYGNMVICVAKFGAWLSSGSSSMLSEFIHSVVDCGNQSLLLVGLRDSKNVADRKHPYGYGKSVYFWALVSALGTFFLGAGVSMRHAIGELMDPSLQDITWQVWGVLGISLLVDGYVLGVTMKEIIDKKPKEIALWDHLSNLRDPATLAILLEDGAACAGILIALAGISATHATGLPVFDGLAGVGISTLLAGVGLVLVRVNHRFLLGQAVDRDITEGIETILRSQKSIDNVQSVQSQWTSSETFSYKAEVDFDGTFLAAKLMPRYQHEFLQVKDSMDEELRVLLSWYAEDVIRTVEREVRHIESEIRKKYPGAEYIELEPMSKDADRFAVDDALTGELRRVELEALNRYLRSLYLPRVDDKKGKKGFEKNDDKPQKK